MKKFNICALLLLILILLITSVVSANFEVKYWYVAPWGDDTNDGTTIDKPFRTITRALNVSASYPHTSYIYVAEGVYEENIEFRKSNQWLFGGVKSFLNLNDRSGISIIIPTNPAQPAVLLNFAHIDGFTIQGGTPGVLIGDSHSRYGFCTSIENCTIKDSKEVGISFGISPESPREVNRSIRIAGCTIDNSTSSGIAIVGVDGDGMTTYVLQAVEVDIENCTIKNNKYTGIYFRGGNLNVYNCVIERNHEVGINGTCYEDPFNSENTGIIHFQNNIIRENGASGIYLSTPKGDITSNTIIANYGDGINCGAFKLFITDNYIADNLWNGIKARNPVLPTPTPLPTPEPTPIPPYDPIITYNIIERNHLNGVLAVESAYCYTGYNIIRENYISGISATDKTTCIAEYNKISENMQYGIIVSKNAIPTISDNYVIWNFHGGIHAMDNTGAIMRRNHIAWNRGPGIITSEEASPLFLSNKIVGNNDVGVLCQGESSPHFTGFNRIMANRRGGVKVIDSASPEFLGSIIADNVQTGVGIENDAHCRLTNTTICQNTENGVVLKDNATAIIVNTIISDNAGFGIAEQSPNADPLEVSYNCFYNNESGDYKDEVVHIYNGADQINNLVNNNGRPCYENISADPRFVRWGEFSFSNPIYVDDDATSPGDGHSETPYPTVTDALISYSYQLASGSTLIGRGKDGEDIGSFPQATNYPPQGSSLVKVCVRPGEYEESNLVIHHNVWLSGEQGAVLQGHPEFNMIFAGAGSIVEGVEVVDANAGIMMLKDCDSWIRYVTLRQCNVGLDVSRADAQITGCSIIDSILFGIRVFSSSPIIEYSSIMGSGEWGISCESNSSPLITKNIISENNNGIAVVDGSSAQISSNEISHNQGSGIYCQNASVTTIEENIISNNKPGIKVDQGSTCNITNNVIAQNIDYGILTMANDVTAYIEKNVIRENTWDGICSQDAHLLSVNNNFIYKNSNDGVAILNAGTSYLVNNTIADNFDDGISLASISAPIINSNILAGNTGYGIREISMFSDPLSVRANCFYNNAIGDYLDEGINIYCGSSAINSLVNNNGNVCADNISVDPMFAQPSTGDYHLSQNSGCIDMGTAEFAPPDDIDDERRPQLSGYDIGADEFCQYWDYYTADAPSEWDFVSAPGVFTPPITTVSADGISLTSTNNTNTFGYWANNKKPFTIYNDNLYRARFVISTDVSDRARVPHTRVRINTADYKSYDSLLITSIDKGVCAPTPEGMTYELYFFPAQNSAQQIADNKLRKGIISFDMLNFDPLDAETATLTLKQVEISRIPISEIGGGTPVCSFDFESDNQGWIFSSEVAPYTPPVAPDIAGGLALQSTNNFNTFGYWANDDVLTGIDSTLLYSIKFRVKSNQTDPSRSPELRIRAYDDSYQLTTAKGAKSLDDGSDSPEISGKNYILFYQPMSAIDGSTLGLAFDLINFDSTDAPDGILFLDSVQIRSYPIPVFE